MVMKWVMCLYSFYTFEDGTLDFPKNLNYFEDILLSMGLMIVLNYMNSCIIIINNYNYYLIIIYLQVPGFEKKIIMKTSKYRNFLQKLSYNFLL